MSTSDKDVKAKLQGCNDSKRLYAESSAKQDVSEDADSFRSSYIQLNSNSSNSKSKKQDRSDERGLYGYNKKKILKHLMTNGCSAWRCTEAMGSFKVDPDTALAYFNNQAQLAQNYVHEESGSLSFENISDWLVLLQNVGLHSSCRYEAALITKAIADNEKHPSTKDLDGVELKSIYKFIGNALMGLPQVELNKESAQFLSNEFECLINEANTDLADAETRYMKQILEQIADTETFSADKNALNRLSLDPFGLDKDIH